MKPKRSAPGETAAASARPASSPEAQEQYMINLAECNVLASPKR